jgi:NTE family protein
LTKDRENDIRFHDKTEYDLKMGKVVDDYKVFVDRMTDVAVQSIRLMNLLARLMTKNIRMIS